MDVNSRSSSQELSHPYLPAHINNGLAVERIDMPACGLCGRTLSSEGEIHSSLHAVSICGDCKFLLLEDFGTPSHDSQRRRLRRRRRSAHGSSESIENSFSQLLQMINVARHIDPEHETLSQDADSNLRSLQLGSSHTTPNGSRRWQRTISDTESDGFNSDSLYGESESNVSLGAYRVYHGDSDVISFSAYGGDSDASVDPHLFLDVDMFGQSMERSDIDSDSDIDPMHAGVVQWNSDDHQEVDDDDDDDDQGGEVDVEENEVGPRETGAHVDSTRSSNLLVRHIRTNFPEFDGVIGWRIGDIQIPMEESADATYLGNPGDYLDAQGFEELLEHLTEADSSRRGAPPASASFLSSLPLVVISEKLDGVACAICKDLLSIGTEVNQLPCLHLYHPSCILPWLSSRNSCPLCRYELPTDDKDYEQRKLSGSSRTVITEIQERNDRDDSSSIDTDTDTSDEMDEFGEVLASVGPDWSSNGGRGRWLFIAAAAPIVSLMGIVLVLWLGNPLSRGRGPPPRQIHSSGSCPRNQRERRWWWWF